jgi:hypothetical protein
MLTPDAIDSILALVPDEWLVNSAGTSACGSTASDTAAAAARLREAYARYLRDRLEPPRTFVAEAADAR